MHRSLDRNGHITFALLRMSFSVICGLKHGIEFGVVGLHDCATSVVLFAVLALLSPVIFLT